MRAIGIRAYGGPEELVLLEQPPPHVEPGRVVIRVKAAGVAFSDVKMRRGDFGTDPAALPLRLGLEVAGVVDAVGSGVLKLAAGDDVFAYLSKPGGYAEFVAEDATLVARMPRSLTYVEAAALPLAAITAATAVDLLQLTSGSSVYIPGGAGGVGSYAVQLAVAAGARVVVSGRAEDEAHVRALGAQAYVDFRTGDVAAQVRALVPGGADVAIDAVGAESAATTMTAVKPGGKLVDLGWSGELGGDPSIEVLRFSAQPSGERLERIAELVDAGKLKVTVERTFPLAEARAAHELVEARSVRGKLVLTL